MRSRQGSAAHSRRLAVALIAPALLWGCASAPAPVAAPQQPQAARPQAPPVPLVASGDAIPLGEAPPAIVHRGAAAELHAVGNPAPAAAVTPGGDVTLNFTDADIHAVVRAVVGDILGLNYFIDSKVQGTVTVQTSRPLPRAAVLPTLGRVLRASGAALIEDDGMVRVTPLDSAAKGAAPQGAAVQPALGFGVRVVPLKYVPAAEIQKVLEPFVSTGALLQIDAIHNILVLSGSREDVASLAELVQTFDADWLSRMSFALVPLRAGPAETIVNEMSAIIAGASGGAEGAADSLRLVPLERLNAVLVITAQARYLDWARQQIATLDAGGDDGVERTFIYHVQYGRASDLADVLGRVFGSGGSAASSSSSRSSSNSGSYLQPSFGSTGASLGGAGAPLGSATATTGSTMPSTGTASSAAAPTGGLGAASPLASLLGSGQSGSPNPTSPSPPPNGSTTPETSATPGQPTVRIVNDERNNALIIVTTPRQYRRVAETLRRLDVRPLQVVIEATIAEVTLNDQLQFGLQWFFRQGNNNAAFTNVSTSVPGQTFPGFSYLLSEANVQVVLNALAALTTVNVVSSPQLMVLNNQTAQLQVGQQVPVPVAQQQSVVTPEAPLVNTISYLNTGVILQVTPRANATGEVTLDIEQEVSDVASVTTGGLSAPTINERRVKSTVSVESGESVALGGLISNSVSKNRSSVPLLGDIPVVGALFRNDNNTTMRTELLVLIEPRIINGSDDARAATDDLRRRMHDIQPIDVPDR